VGIVAMGPAARGTLGTGGVRETSAVKGAGVQAEASDAEPASKGEKGVSPLPGHPLIVRTGSGGETAATADTAIKTSASAATRDTRVERWRFKSSSSRCE
jgi:hypothetical protein